MAAHCVALASWWSKSVLCMTQSEVGGKYKGGSVKELGYVDPYAGQIKVN